MSETAAQDVTDRQILSKEYGELTEKFIQACHSFDSIRNKIQEFKPEIADEPMLNWHLEFEAIHKLNFWIIWERKLTCAKIAGDVYFRVTL